MILKEFYHHVLPLESFLRDHLCIEVAQKKTIITNHELATLLKRVFVAFDDPTELFPVTMPTANVDDESCEKQLLDQDQV